VTPEVGSYDIGLMLGGQLEHNGVVPIMSLDAVIRGIKDSVGCQAAPRHRRQAYGSAAPATLSPARSIDSRE
jgi:hypothetical protein